MLLVEMLIEQKNGTHKGVRKDGMLNRVPGNGKAGLRIDFKKAAPFSAGPPMMESSETASGWVTALLNFYTKPPKVT